MSREERWPRQNQDEEMKTYSHEEKKGKVNTRSQKNTTHFITNAANSFWTDLKHWETWSGIIESRKEISIVLQTSYGFVSAEI